MNYNPRHGRRRPRPMTTLASITLALIAALVLASLIFTALAAV